MSTLKGTGVKVLVRRGPKVERRRFDDLGAALAFVEGRGRELEEGVDTKAVSLPLGRSFEPVQRVVARIEVGGGGVDIRGDGSCEAWTGRFRRRLVEQRDGESPYDALRRALT
ncbi:MAG: hypothetical protein WD844_07875 [Thermoleophilaceae bacterium]